MSQVYSTEPQPTGRVVLNTSHGPIDVSLFCKECPTTSRSFLQLCLDGFYDNVIFHRIIANFLIQVGHRSIAGVGSGSGRYDNIDSKVDVMKKKLEVIPRIKFNHRGQVAMALPLDDDTVGNHVDDTSSSDSDRAALARQFFITMDEAPFLDKKYVIFGTVRGDTVFNALRIGKTETIGDTGELADSDRGNAPRIVNVRIVNHIFDDLTATPDAKVPWKQQATNAEGKESNENALKKRRKRRKGKKDLNVLSFGAEMEDMDDGLPHFGKKAKKTSPANNLRIGGMAPDARSADEQMQKSHGSLDDSSSSKTNGTDRIEKGNSLGNQDETNGYFEKSQSPSDATPLPNTSVNVISSNGTHHDDSNGRKHSKIPPQTMVKSTTINIASAKTPKMSTLEARRLKYLNRNKPKASKQRDDETMSKLNHFKTKMFQAKGFNKSGPRTNHDLSASYDSGRSTNLDAIDNGHSNDHDYSLASRLARKEKIANEKKSNLNNDRVPVYSGQILEDDGENGMSVNDLHNSSKWMQATFKCRRHIDHDSKDQAISSGGASGDGRHIEDYEVIDDSKRRKPRHKR